MNLYKKNDNEEYEIVGMSFTGWPSNGIWLVKDGKQNCIIPIKGIPSMPSPTLVSYMQYQDELSEHIHKKWNEKGMSVYEFSKIACEFFAIKAGGMKVLNNIIEG